jgi:large subunit ribosomal protein L12e
MMLAGLRRLIDGVWRAQMRSRSMAKTLRGTVKEMLGTAFSVGCTVNGKSPKDLCDDIDEGTVTIPEK